MMRKVQGCCRSRTMWFSLLLVILGAVADNLSYIQSAVDERYYGFIVMGIGVIIAVLRFNTDKALEDR